MSWSVSYDNYDQIEKTLQDLAGSGRRIGLVLFSDIAYEALPPGTRASELRPYLRFFRTRGVTNPWQDAFAGGTRIWSALDLAHRMLKRDHVTNGAVVLISDLADAPNDRALLGQTLAGYVDDRIPIKIVALDPTPDDKQLFARALAHGGGAVETLGPTSHVLARHRTRPALPTALLVGALALALLLAANELALGRASLEKRVTAAGGSCSGPRRSVSRSRRSPRSPRGTPERGDRPSARATSPRASPACRRGRPTSWRRSASRAACLQLTTTSRSAAPSSRSTARAPASRASTTGSRGRRFASRPRPRWRARSAATRTPGARPPPPTCSASSR